MDQPLPAHLRDTVDRVTCAISSGGITDIEYMMHDGVRTLADANALLSAVNDLSNRMPDQDWYRLWIADLTMILGRSRDAQDALTGIGGYDGDARMKGLCEKFSGLFGFAPWYRDWVDVRSEHFVWHVAKHFPEGFDCEGFMERREIAYRDIRDFFGCEPERKIEVFVWNSREQARDLLKRALGFAIPQYFLIHCAMDQSPGHEIAHIFAHFLPGAGAKTALIAEGVAVLLDGTGADHKHAAAAAMRKYGVRELNLTSLWHDFHSVPWEISYPAAGFFCQMLLARLGKGLFLEIVRHQTYAFACARAEWDAIHEVIIQTERDLCRAAMEA